MTRKLPKATSQTFDEIRHESAGSSEAPDKKPRRRPRPSSPHRPKATAAKTKRADRTTAATAAAAVAAETKTADQATAATADAADRSPNSELATEYRRSRAREIVGRFTTYSAVGGFLPIPFVDTFSVMASIVRMVQLLAKLYDVPFHRDRTRAAVAALVGGFGQAGAGAVTTTALLKSVPGPNLYGSAMSSIASAVLTRAMGRAFILHFETGGTALEFDPATLAKYFRESRDGDAKA